LLLAPSLNGAPIIVEPQDDFLSIFGSELTEENVSLSFNAPAIIEFDALGRPVSGDTLICTSGCEIDFVGAQLARVCIEPEGYIHKGDCGG
jgi:hypothetical protein